MIYTHVLNRGGKGVVSPADIVAERSPLYAALISPADMPKGEYDVDGNGNSTTAYGREEEG